MASFVFVPAVVFSFVSVVLAPTGDGLSCLLFFVPLVSFLVVMGDGRGLSCRLHPVKMSVA